MTPGSSPARTEDDALSAVVAARRGPYAKGLAKRDEILERALEHFARTGYDRASVREIARDCGLSQAGLLHHFSSKEELFLEVLRRRDGRAEDADRSGHTVATLIDVVAHNVDEPGLVRLFVAMSAESTDDDSPARGFFASRYAQLTRDLAADVDQQSGRTDVKAADIAILLVAAADGLQLQWLLEPERSGMAPLLGELWQVLRSPSDD